MAPDLARRIFIRDFRLQVSIGIHDFEKEGPQTVVVNVDLELAPADKAHNDRIGNVLNYDVVHDGIMALAGSRHFNLQETLVDAILDLCLAQPGVLATVRASGVVLHIHEAARRVRDRSEPRD